MYCLGPDGLPSDPSNDLFGQFMNFDGDGVPETSLDDCRSGNPDSFFMNPAAMLTASSVVSSADDFDFFSTHSRLGTAKSAASHGVDASELAFEAPADPATGGTHRRLGYLGRKSVSDTALQRLGDISLDSPQKNASSVSHTTSPTLPNITRKPKKLVEAISSTLRKATTTLGRKSRKQQQELPIERAASPTLEHPPMAIKSHASRMHSITQSSMSSSVPHESPSPMAYDPNSSTFIHGFCDDPFAEQPRPYPSPGMQYYNHGGMDPTPTHGSVRRIKSEQQLYQGPPSMMASTATVDAATQIQQQQQQHHQQHHHQQQHQQHHQQQQQGGWQQPMMTPTEQWGGPEYVSSQDPGWWDLSMNASVNQAMHSQHNELPYEYAPLPDESAAGLMIHMPQPRPSQPGDINDIALTTQTFLPPPPPIPGAERCRPPRAPSSGTRHRNMSSSPMRKTHGPSAPPTQAQPQMRNQSRHSSTGSISSVRSTSGRGPGSVPNTPGGIRKRRSRDVVGGGLIGGASLGVSLGGDDDEEEDDGFINFTPNDGSMLMTGVAPSGSSKTKARREKEAQEKRRRLSEAAMKAVAAAGGDVDKLIQEGFVF